MSTSDQETALRAMASRGDAPDAQNPPKTVEGHTGRQIERAECETCAGFGQVFASRDVERPELDRWYQCPECSNPPLTAEQERCQVGIDPATIPAQRAAGWPDFHPEDYCHQCGRPNIRSWHAPEWVQLTGSDGNILCPVCFAALDSNAIWCLRRHVDPMTDQVARLAALLDAVGGAKGEDAERVARCVLDFIGPTAEQERLIALGKVIDGQAEMLRRAAQACQNVKPASAEWFTWVPKHLVDIADRLTTAEAERSRGATT